MRLPQSGLRIDNPSWPLIQGQISYWGVTSANGNALGTTFVCADLDNWPTYVPLSAKMLTGPSAGQVRTMLAHAAGGIITVDAAFTDAAGAAQQIVAGTLFCILSGGSGGGVLPYIVIGYGTFDTDSQTVPADSTRAGLYAWENNDYFKGCILMPVEGDCRFQPRPISEFAVAGGIFTLDEPFSQLPGTVRYVIISSDYPYQRLIDIFNIVNAILETTETGGTITTDGTEQNAYINNAPAGVYEPLNMMLDCTNMQAGDSLRIRVYYRITPGGNLRKKDDLTLNDAQDPALINIGLEPNRYGIEVTIQRTAGGDRDYDWSVIYRG